MAFGRVGHSFHSPLYLHYDVGAAATPINETRLLRRAENFMHPSSGSATVSHILF